MDNEKLLDHEKAERILREGWQLFEQKGYRGVSIDELCARCNLTKPTLYYYFHDKENLFVQVLQYKLKGFHAVIEQPGNISERLQRIAASILDSFQTEYNALLRDREHIKDEANLQRIREAFHKELFGPLNRLMLSGMKEDILARDNPEFLALIFMGITNNFIGRRAEFDLDNAALATKLVEYFLKGAGKIE